MTSVERKATDLARSATQTIQAATPYQARMTNNSKEPSAVPAPSSRGKQQESDAAASKPPLSKEDHMNRLRNPKPHEALMANFFLSLLEKDKAKKTARNVGGDGSATTTKQTPSSASQNNRPASRSAVTTDLPATKSPKTIATDRSAQKSKPGKHDATAQTTTGGTPAVDTIPSSKTTLHRYTAPSPSATPTPATQSATAAASRSTQPPAAHAQDKQTLKRRGSSKARPRRPSVVITPLKPRPEVLQRSPLAPVDSVPALVLHKTPPSPTRAQRGQRLSDIQARKRDVIGDLIKYGKAVDTHILALGPYRRAHRWRSE